MKAVVLAAGEGRRMRPLTASRPKVMLPLAGRPMLEHVLRGARAAGMTEAVVVVGYKEEAVRDRIGDGAALGLRVSYVRQVSARGTGDALLAAREHLRGAFLVLNGDTLLGTSDLRALAAAKGFAVGAREVADGRPYGVLVTRGGDAVERIVEKSASPPSRLANVGAYRLDEGVLPYLEGLGDSERGERELPDALNAALRERAEVRAVPVASWRDVSRPWDLLGANEALMRDLEPRVEGTVERRATVIGPVAVGPGAVVRDGCTVEGPVFVGPGCRVGPNAYLRPFTVLEARNHVGASSEVKNSILLEGANAPHLNYVGDSVLGARVNLGAGTITANLRFDHKPIRAHAGPGQRAETGRTKFGAIVGDDAQTGIHVALNVGVVVGEGAWIGPGRRVDGYVEPGARLP